MSRRGEFPIFTHIHGYNALSPGLEGSILDLDQDLVLVYLDVEHPKSFFSTGYGIW